MWTRRAPPLLIPDDGGDSPVFATVDPGDAVQVTLLFEGPLDAARLDAAEVVVLSWFATATWGGSLPELTHETLTPACLHLGVTGVTAARDALMALLRGMEKARVPVRRAIFGRVRADGDRDALVRALDPTACPEARYDDPESWWRACFDASMPPPLSEDPDDLASDENAIVETARSTFVEQRSMPLHVAGIRVCHGLADVSFEPESADDAIRSHRTTLRFNEAIDACFGDAAPAFYTRARHRDAALDRIRSAGRLGYSCAFHANDLREFLYDHHYRYREHELMRAARDAIAALDLAPVVCWRRFPGRYVVQLWERTETRPGARAHVAA